MELKLAITKTTTSVFHCGLIEEIKMPVVTKKPASESRSDLMHKKTYFHIL